MSDSLELKPIENSSRNRGQLYAALDIYREGVRPEEQNPEAQIIHWIDHRKELKADQFRCFTINMGKQVVGYVQFSFFSEENIIFWEYLCLDKSAMSGLGPSRGVLTTIRKYLVENYPPNFTVVFEVAHEKLASGKRVSDQKRLKYFGRIGFRRVDYPYRFPVLQTYDGENSYQADLLVMLPQGRKVVSAAELRTILRCLYYKHYLRWDRPFLDKQQFDKRQQLIDALYASQISQIGNSDKFNTEGDDRRLGILSFERLQPKLGLLASKLFGPKLFRLLVVLAAVLLLEKIVGNAFALIPIALVGAIFYCLAEDTETASKMLSAVASKLSPPRQQP